MRTKALKNLLIVSGYWPSEEHPISGVFVAQQVAALCRKGCRITLIVGNSIGRRVAFKTPAALGLPPDLVTLVEVVSLRFPEKLSSNFLTFSMNVAFLASAVRKRIETLRFDTSFFDGCIVHSLRYHAFAAPYWMDKLSCPKVAVCHGVDPFLSQPKVRRFLDPHISNIEATFSKVVLVGSPLREDMKFLGVHEAGILIIPNGTELPEAPRPQPIRKQGPSTVLLSVSRLIELKGIDDNIKAIAILRDRFDIADLQYRVVGDGPEKSRLQKLAASLCLDDQLVFLGQLPFDETMKEIESADIFSLPSWGEAFGIVYLEAMARMKPAIGCIGNGAADIITNDKDGMLVPPRDPESLAIAIKKLHEAPALRNQMGSEARVTAEAFTWEINAKRLLCALGLQ